MCSLSHKRAFTLIEMLTVVTILLIVSAIVYPAFVSAREKGRQTTCISQMRQICLAYQMYRQDHNGRDEGTTFADFGLPDRRVRSKAIDAYNIPVSIRKCPSRHINIHQYKEDKECPRCVTYARYDTFSNIDIPHLWSSDPTWPLHSCEFHDTRYWANSHEVKHPRSLGIGLDGSLSWRELYRLNAENEDQTKGMQL